MSYKTLFSFIIYIVVIPLSFSQKIVRHIDAIELALENNFDIKIINNTNKISKNNASFLNSGYLPVLSLNAASTGNISNSENIFRDGNTRTLNDAKTRRSSFGLDLNYTVFNGLKRMYNYKKFKEQYKLSEYMTKDIISKNILSLSNIYFQVAYFTEYIKTLHTTLDISKKRYKRLKYLNTFGQNTGLEILNAQVDVNTDSINLINAQQTLRNLKRDLTLVINDPNTVVEEVDTTIVFYDNAFLKNIYDHALEKNFEYNQLKNETNISQYDNSVIKGAFLPTLRLTGSYNWNDILNNDANFISESNSTGFALAINLNWDIFAGGKAINNLKNSKITHQNNLLDVEKRRLRIKRDLITSWENYQNNRFVYSARKKQVQTNRNNFKRSTEKYNLGSITGIEFRQSQINLQMSINQKNLAKYTLKESELQILYLGGELMNIVY